ncbi:IS1096 element passenger TnpR family protein [Wenzhouxiangella sp. EGI_FJ10409]|uniref:IS1096 element passenger TnpR family protein n=1 Tax=Wenzhouxiangella sp. EGI_FJ10409 TaxID=3243767 RepID=UPI0035DC3629
MIFPRNATLHELHRAIQELFDWYDYHLYQFDIDGRCFEAPDVAPDFLDECVATVVASHFN